MSEEKKDVKVPKTFMAPAYVEEVDQNVFAMYRDILVEENGVREKFGKRIGPMYLFRPVKKGEAPDFRTVRPDGTVVELFRFYPPKGEAE